MSVLCTPLQIKCYQITLESARAGAEDDSMLDNVVNDLGMETDMSLESKTSSRSAVSKSLNSKLVSVAGARRQR